ncbi:unnamed protein product, partial [Symbiodinium sp. KB8]
MAMVTATAVVISPFSPTPVATAAGPASDDFSSGGYSGGTGWAGDWDENNDGDSPTTGNIRVVNQQLRFRGIDSNDSIERDVNLSGYSDGATLSFTIVTNDNDEDLALRIGGTTVAVTPESPNGTRLSYVIPSNLLTNTTLSIVSTTGAFSSNEEIVLDDIEIADYVANPDLDASCGIDVEIILDESGSIDSEGAIPEVEGAVRAFAQGLAGTTSSLRFMEFSTTGRDATIGGSNALQEVDAALLDDIDAYLNGTGPTGDPNNADLVVFITDGVPNTVGTVSPSNNNGGGSDASAAAAFEEAAAVRAAGTKLLGVGVGQ